MIIYHKAYPDGRILYVEEIRGKKRGELAFVSMRKYKQRKGGLPNETTSASTLGSSDLSVGKDNTNSSNLQENPQEKSIEKEIEDVRRSSQTDGTFMKAPNGSDSNLSEEDWLTARTPQFKKEIGDWEEPTQYTANNVDDPADLERRYPSTLPNKYYHHSTNVYGRQPFDPREGKKERLHIIGRLTTGKVDALVVENPNSDNETAHITLATEEGVPPVTSNTELKKHRGEIVPLDDYVDTTFTNNLRDEFVGKIDENGETLEDEIRKFRLSINTGQENGDNVSDSVSLNFGGGADRERVNLSDVKRYAQSVKVPERITSQAQAVSWAYQALGGIRGMLSNLYGETGSRDFSMGLLSMDPTKGREMDTDKAMYSRGRVRQYLDLVQPKLYEARDNSTSEETRKFFQDLIDDCNYARQWYDRAAEGDTSIFDENRPRFSIDDKRDEVYLESVKKGDEKTASEMVRVGKS